MPSCPAGGRVDVAVCAVRRAALQIDHDDGDVADVLAAHEGAVREEVAVLRQRVVLAVPLAHVLAADEEDRSDC